MDFSTPNAESSNMSFTSDTNESSSLPASSQEDTTDFSSFRIPKLTRATEESNPDLDSSLEDGSIGESEEDPLATDLPTPTPTLRIKLGDSPKVVLEPMPDVQVFRTPSSETGSTRKRGRGSEKNRGRGTSATRGRGRGRVKEAGAFLPLDEETRNSFPVAGKDDSSSLTEPAPTVDETSQSSTGSASTKKRSKLEVFDPDVDRVVTADQIFEYQWPANERHADFCMLQEQIADFLGVKSFKRKYPKMTRRALERDEKIFLKEKGVVSETIFDLGVTVLRSEEALDAMAQDFPDKFEELRRAMVEKRQKKLQERRQASLAPAKSGLGVDNKVHVQKITDPRLRLVHETADWNARVNRDRREERPCSFDLSNMNVVYPTNKVLTLKPELTKKGAYPVALMPAQYSDYYRTYSSDELKYLPLNTVLYGPVNPYADVDLVDDKEDTPVESSSSSDSGSESESETEDSERQCKFCKASAKANAGGFPGRIAVCSSCESAGQRCVSCGSTSPGSDDSVWASEKLEGDSTGCSVTLCVACAPLFKEKKFCPMCLACFPKPDEEMAKCGDCTAWVHFECCQEISAETKVAFGKYFEELSQASEDSVKLPEFSCEPCSSKAK